MKNLIQSIILSIPRRVLVLIMFILGGAIVGISGFIALELTGRGSFWVCLNAGLITGLTFGIWALLEQ